MTTEIKTHRKPRNNRYSPEIVKDCRESGLTKTEYAIQKGIHPSVLYRWMVRYEEENGKGSFVKIEPQKAAPDRDTAIEIILPDGIRIRGGSIDETCEIVKLIRGL